METDLHTARVHFVATEDFVAEVDEWRRAQPDLPTRSAALRRLVEIGLANGDTAPKRVARR